jgi:DNA-binding MarR family transcriptional regulator
MSSRARNEPWPVPRSGAAAWLSPGRSGERLSPLDSPSTLMWRLQTQLSRRFNRDYAKALGITSPAIRLLTLLHERGALNFRLIVEGSLMDKAQVSRTLSPLISGGFVSVAGRGRDGKRLTALSTASLTEDGNRLFEKALIIARRHQLALLRQLSRRERSMLHAVLHRLIRDVENMLIK